MEGGFSGASQGSIGFPGGGLSSLLLDFTGWISGDVMIYSSSKLMSSVSMTKVWWVQWVHSGLWEVVNPVRFLENFHKNVAELRQAFLNLIDRRPWGCKSRSMKDGSLWFPVVSHKDVVLSHYLEVSYALSSWYYSM